MTLRDEHTECASTRGNARSQPTAFDSVSTAGVAQRVRRRGSRGRLARRPRYAGQGALAARDRYDDSLSSDLAPTGRTAPLSGQTTFREFGGNSMQA